MVPISPFVLITPTLTRIQNSWDEIIEVLSENEENTISYLENCNKEDLYWISEVFEDLAESLQSKERLTSNLRDSTYLTLNNFLLYQYHLSFLSQGIFHLIFLNN